MYLLKMVHKNIPIKPISGRGSTLDGFSEISVWGANFRVLHWIYIKSVHVPCNNFNTYIFEHKMELNLFFDKHIKCTF